MNEPKIPWGITHKVTTPAPKPTKAPPPSEERLKLMIANGGADVAQLIIDDYGLPYKIVDNKLVDSLVGSDRWLQKFITVDTDTLSMLDDVRKLAKSNDEVLIIGETGTGKELISKGMIGDRKGMTVAVNCAGLPDTLIESELFGHVRGSFTGADKDKNGLMAAAKEGVLFLDEIGELSMNVQAKLLRAIQDRRIRKVGSNTDEEITCKIVCATHRNIKQMVKDGTFREDLYARISTFELHIKALRYRTCDVVPIIQSLKSGPEFLEACAARTIIPTSLDLSLNVRSLQQYVRRFAVLGRVGT